MDAPDTTVLLPTVDRPALLRAALRSIQTQSAVARIREVIVSENGQPSGAAAVCEEFSASLPIKYCLRRPALSVLGHCKAFLGASYESKYVAILHDDDWWTPGHLQRSLELLERHPAAAACLSAYFETPGESEPLNPHLLQVNANLMAWIGGGCRPMTEAWLLEPEAMILGCLPGTPGHYSSLVARSPGLPASAYVYDYNDPYDYDRLLFLALARLGPIVFDPIPGVCVRLHPGQDLRNFSNQEVCRHMLETTSRALDFARELKFDFLGALKERLDRCPDEHKTRIDRIFSWPWVKPVLSRALSDSAASGRSEGPHPKILFISPDTSRTGATVSLLQFLRWLRQETRQEFEVLVGSDGPLLSEFAKVAKLHSPQTLGGRPELTQRLFFRQFDLIYANTGRSSLLLSDLPYGDIPIVTHLHELDCGIDLLGAKNFAGVARQTNRYIACAGAVAEQLGRRFRIPQEQISVHYRGIAPPDLAPGTAAESPENLRKKYALPENAIVLAACGAIEMRKGPDLFVRLATYLRRQLGSERPLRCVWIGPPKDAELAQALAHDIRRLGLQQEIQWVGELLPPHGLLALSDVFCVTSREDSFPLAMLEAAALGKPTVCFDGAGGSPEFCALGGGLAVPFLDVAAMAEKCLALIEQPALRQEIGQKAAALVSSRFTVESLAPKLWKEIDQLLQQPPPRSVHWARQSSLAEIFATWSPEDTPEPGYVLPIVARSAARRQAAAQLAAGQLQEAIKTLIRAVRVDSASKDQSRILDGLVEISEDLAPIDEAKSRFLRAEAEKIARGLKRSLAPAGSISP